jgi:hypothetical protein
VRGHVVGGVVPTFARQIVWHSLAPLRLPEPPGMQFWLGRAASSGCARWVTGAPTGSRTSPPPPREHDPVAGYRLEQRLPRHCRVWTSDDPDRDTWHDCLIWVHTT